MTSQKVCDLKGCVDMVENLCSFQVVMEHLSNSSQDWGWVGREQAYAKMLYIIKHLYSELSY